MRRAADLEAELSKRLQSSSAHDSNVPLQTPGLGAPVWSEHTLHNRVLGRSTVSSELFSFMGLLSTRWNEFSFRPPRFAANARSPTTALPGRISDALKSRGPEKRPILTLHEKKPVIIRALVQHWIEVVQPEFPLLNSDQISFLDKSDGRSSIPERPTSLSVVVAAGVYAVSAALIARDCNPDLEKLERYYLQELEDNIQARTSGVNDPDRQRREVTALLFKALHQLVNPTQQNINLHVFISLISRRYTEYFGPKDSPFHLQKELDQVGICLYILERYLNMVFELAPQLTTD